MATHPRWGEHFPDAQYVATVVDSFPRVDRHRQVESSISNKYTTDVLPLNLPPSGGKLTDPYLEFRIPPSPDLTDISNLAIELSLSITKEDGITPVEETDNVMFANGIANTVFRAVQIFLGGTTVENQPYHAIKSYIKLLTSMSPSKAKSLARLGFFHEEGLFSGKKKLCQDNHFQEANAREKAILTEVREKGLHVTFPLLVDVSSCESYLPSNLDMTIRLELADRKFVLQSPKTDAKFQYQINSAKLWVTRVQPHSTALIALEKTFLAKGFLDILFAKTLYK